MERVSHRRSPEQLFAELQGPALPEVEPLPETKPDIAPEEPERAPIEPAPFQDPAKQPSPCPKPSHCPMP